MKKTILKFKRLALKLVAFHARHFAYNCLLICAVAGGIGGAMVSNALKAKDDALEAFKESYEYQIYRADEMDKYNDLHEKYILQPHEAYLKGEIDKDELEANSKIYEEEIKNLDEEGFEKYANVNDEVQEIIKKGHIFGGTSVPFLSLSMGFGLAGMGLIGDVDDTPKVLADKIDHIDEEICDLDEKREEKKKEKRNAKKEEEREKI